MYDVWGANEDERFSEELKSRRERNGDIARLRGSRLGKRPERPMLVDFQKLAAIGVKLRRYR